MAMPAITKTYTHVTNQRVTFVSIIDTMAQLLYNIFSAQLVTVGGFTCVGSSTGVTATGNLSGTNTWASAANTGVRGANTTSIQSWFVFRDGNGVDWLVAHQGAADGNVKLSYSVGQLWTLNGTNAAFQPTATDEVIVATNAFMLPANSASLDRIWSMQWSSDRKIWRCWVVRNNAMTAQLAGEVVAGSVVGAGNASPVVAGFASTNGNSATNTAGGVVGPQSTNLGGMTRFGVNTATVAGGGEGFLGSLGPNVLTDVAPALNGASPVTPVNIISTQTNYRGKVATRIDVWHCFEANALDQSADVFSSATYTSWGSCGTYPFDGSTKVLS